MKTLKDLPSEFQLVTEFDNPYLSTPLNVNAHFHTPYSFSAFDSIHEIFEKAEEEKIGVLGINDFITTFGYVEFNDLANRYQKFPLFCIEFMGLMKNEQDKGIRINDPNNPGRIYLCGKGLAFPEQFSESSRILLQRVFDESQRQTKTMTEKLNVYLKGINAQFELHFEKIKNSYSKGMVRERHIAKALRIEILKHYPDKENFNKFLSILFPNNQIQFDKNYTTVLDNELRSKLLKKGGIAFVEEDENAFLSLDQIKQIVLDAKGIPFYPVLLDDKNGNYTEFEADPEKLFIELSKRKIYAVEFIPGRNDIKHLKKYLQFFSEKGFIITMGSEHNTPDRAPLILFSRDQSPLEKELKAINYYGACIIAAHQFFIAKGKEGYLTKEGFPKMEKQDEFITLGNAVIRHFTFKKS